MRLKKYFMYVWIGIKTTRSHQSLTYRDRKKNSWNGNSIVVVEYFIPFIFLAGSFCVIHSLSSFFFDFIFNVDTLHSLFRQAAKENRININICSNRAAAVAAAKEKNKKNKKKNKLRGCDAKNWMKNRIIEWMDAMKNFHKITVDSMDYRES